MSVKYVIDDETMTQIADPLRSLLGREDELTPAEMAEAGETANAEAQTQTDLIAQIRTALNGKAAGEGGGDGNTDELMIAFAERTLTHLVLPEGVKSVADNAFYSWKSLTKLSLPSTLESIGMYAFRNLSITELVIPASVKTIKGYAFNGCNSLTTVTFKGVPTTIAANALSTSSITTINVPWPEGAVADAPWGATNATIHYGQ